MLERLFAHSSLAERGLVLHYLGHVLVDMLLLLVFSLVICKVFILGCLQDLHRLLQLIVSEFLFLAQL